MSSPLDAFAAAAEAYCAWAEIPSRGALRDARAARALTAELFRRAIELPPGDPETDAADVSPEDYRVVYERFGALPFNYYAECFDPLALPAEEPVTADLADDLADIWRDVKAGLLLFRAGHHAAAAWHWRFHFETHWGHHATAALYALQSWFSAHADEMEGLE